MKNILSWLAAIVGAIIFIGLLLYGTRLFSNATTPITLVSPRVGITCASMVTSDGAAISCWKD